MATTNEIEARTRAILGVRPKPRCTCHWPSLHGGYTHAEDCEVERAWADAWSTAEDDLYEEEERGLTRYCERCRRFFHEDDISGEFGDFCFPCSDRIRTEG